MGLKGEFCKYSVVFSFSVSIYLSAPTFLYRNLGQSTKIPERKGLKPNYIPLPQLIVTFARLRNISNLATESSFFSIPVQRTFLNCYSLFSSSYMRNHRALKRSLFVQASSIYFRMWYFINWTIIYYYNYCLFSYVLFYKFHKSYN